MAKQRSGERETFWREQVRRKAASRLSVRQFAELKNPAICVTINRIVCRVLSAVGSLKRRGGTGHTIQIGLNRTWAVAMEIV